MFLSCSPLSSQSFQLAAILTLVLFTRALAAGSQEPAYSSTTQVIAVDVLLDASSKQAKKKRKGLQVGSLEPTDFRIFLGDLERPIVGLEEPDEETTPWSLLLYFEAALHTQREMAWAASMLGEHGTALTNLGTVTVVLADPSPRVLLEESRDLEEIQEVLARLRLEPRGEDALGQLRRSFLETPDSELSEVSGDGQELLNLEARLIRDRLDVLLLHLVERPPNPRRALIWIGGGFDLQPETYYLQNSLLPSTGIRPWTDEFAATLAAYGWVGLPLVSPLPENRAGIKRGIRIGKFRIRQPFIPPLFVAASYEEDRDPEKAEAYYQLGLSQVQGGNDSEAIESFEQSLFHFYGDPRTSAQQSEALVELGRAYDRLGEDQKAQRAYDAARELTPSVISLENSTATLQAGKEGEEGQEGAAEREDPFLSPSELEDPGIGSLVGDAHRAAGLADIDVRPAAQRIADLTAGRVIQDREALGRELVALGKRIRLTYQVDGPPGGVLQPLEARLANGVEPLRSPSFGRTGSLASVAEARVRQYLVQGGSPETLKPPEIRLSLMPSSLPRDSSLPQEIEPKEIESKEHRPEPRNAELEIDLGGWPASASPLRLTLARTQLDGETTFLHRLVKPENRLDGLYRWPLHLEPLFLEGIHLENGEELWAIAVEDLNSGEIQLLTMEPSELLGKDESVAY